MNKLITVLQGQSIMDISLQEYGSVEGLRYLLEDNPGIEMENIAAGDTLFVRPNEVLDSTIKELFTNKKPASL